jgi:hypothetical protein
MATTTETRTRPPIGTEFGGTSNTTPRPDIRVTQSNAGSNSAFAYIIAALVVIIGGYYVYTSYYSPTITAPAATQSSTLPKSETVIPVAPVPATPPAATTTVTPVEPPATAPAAPATPPATTTTP